MFSADVLYLIVVRQCQRYIIKICQRDTPKGSCFNIAVLLVYCSSPLHPMFTLEFRASDSCKWKDDSRPGMGDDVGPPGGDLWNYIDLPWLPRIVVDTAVCMESAFRNWHWQHQSSTGSSAPLYPRGFVGVGTPNGLTPVQQVKGYPSHWAQSHTQAFPLR